ncbi:hypothetical protein [Aureisphaera sp.]
MKKLKINSIVKVLIVLFVSASCVEQKCTDFEIENSSPYFFGELEGRSNIFEINGDSVSRYIIQDSLLLKNIGHQSMIKSTKENEYHIVLNDTIIKIDILSININDNFENLFNGYWVLKKERFQVWKKFIPNNIYSGNFRVEEGELIEQGAFFPTYIGTLFDRFHLIGFKDYSQSLYLVTSFDEESMFLYNMTKNGKENLELKKYSFSNKSIIGTYEIVELMENDENLFKNFDLDKSHHGVIKDGFYKGDSIYYFQKIDSTGFYMFINNDELYDNTLEFYFTSENRDTIYTNHIYDDRKVFYSKKGN